MSLFELNDYLTWWLKGVHHDGLPRAEPIGSVAGARGFHDGEKAFRSAEDAERSRLGLPSLAVLSAFALRPERPPLGAGGSGVAGPFSREDLPHPPAWSTQGLEALLEALRPRDVVGQLEVSEPEADELRALNSALHSLIERALERLGAPLATAPEQLPQLADELRAIVRATFKALGAHPETAPCELAAWATARARRNCMPETERPIPMLLWCPECKARHVDTGIWANRPHHTHECQECGHTWRPAVEETFGVQFLFKGKPEGGRS